MTNRNPLIERQRMQLFGSGRRYCFNLLFTVCIAVFLNTPSHAEESSLQQYDVEVIIFRVVNPSGSPEDWALEESRAATAAGPVVKSDSDETIVNPPAPDDKAVDVQPLPTAQFKMNAIEATLQRGHSYQPLAHFGWTQPGYALNDPRPVAMTNLIPATAAVTGTVTLTRGRYLRLALNLKWQAPDGKHYVLRQSRRLAHSGEKHYFDHPYFGVITLVTPKE